MKGRTLLQGKLHLYNLKRKKNQVGLEFTTMAKVWVWSTYVHL